MAQCSTALPASLSQTGATDQLVTRRGSDPWATRKAHGSLRGARDTGNSCLKQNMCAVLCAYTQTEVPAAHTCSSNTHVQHIWYVLMILNA